MLLEDRKKLLAYLKEKVRELEALEWYPKIKENVERLRQTIREQETLILRGRGGRPRGELEQTFMKMDNSCLENRGDERQE